MAENAANDPSATVDPQDAGTAQDGPVTSPDNQPGQSEQSIDWKARFDGANRVLALRDKKIADMEAQLAASGQSVEDLQGQLNSQTVALQAKVDALTEQIKTVTGERDEALSTNSALSAYQVKMEALKEFPELLPLADTIPDIPDAETMKQHLQMLAKGVNDITSQKAKQLTAGMTPGAQTPANGQQQYAYSTLDDWQVALNTAAGGDEFAKLSGAFKQWMSKQ
jgi:hypothetical protein